MVHDRLGKTYRIAWEALLRAHGSLVRKMDARMTESGCVSIDVYDVLLALEEAPDRRLTMRELSRRAVLSPSGVTRLIDRLEKLGYVEREQNPADRRSMFAVLKDEGLQARERAWPVFHDAILEEFASHLTEEEAKALAANLLRFIDPSVGVSLYTQ